MREVVDETTGISNKVVTDWKQQPKGNDLKPRITLRDEKGEVITLANGLEARYFMSVDAILSVDNGAHVFQGGRRAGRIPRESSKTRDITGGLPRVAELFEARKPKDYAIISEIDGRVEFGKDYKTKRRIIVRARGRARDPRRVPDPEGQAHQRPGGRLRAQGDLLMDGNPVPHDILHVLGRRGAGRLSDRRDPGGLSAAGREDQRQAHRGDRPPDAAEGRDRRARRDDLPGRRAGRQASEFEEVNAKAEEDGGKPAKGEPVLQGITKASLQTRPSSPRRPSRRPRGADRGGGPRQDRHALVGLKENVIVGRLIPAGTGSAS